MRDAINRFASMSKAGWDKYIQLTHVSPDMGYVEAVASCGLHDMTKEDNIRSVMETLSSHYQDEFTEQMNKAVKEDKLDILMENLQDNVSYYLD